MKHKYPIFIICLLVMILANHPSIADKMTATFTFGKIEILKTGEREWSFLEKGTTLTDTDLIRMPPISLIRIKDAGGTFLPTLSGGRELTVSELIREGLQRRNATKGRRLDEHLEGSPAIDVLPLGDKPKENRSHAPDKSQSSKDAPQRVSTGELEELRRQLDLLPDEITPWILRLPSRDTSVTHSYPSPNLYHAQMLYAALGDIAAKSPDVPNRSLLYAQLLRHVKIDADLITNDSGELCVIFDSDVPLDSAKWMTANHQLIYKKQVERSEILRSGAANTIWISIQVQPEKHNFTTAWYNGTMAR